MTTVSAGQNLPDVCLQEMGGISALFDLADANGLAITDLLTPGRSLTVPPSAAGNADVAGYFAARAQRINTGGIPEAITVVPAPGDFDQKDFDSNDKLSS